MATGPGSSIPSTRTLVMRNIPESEVLLSELQRVVVQFGKLYLEDKGCTGRELRFDFDILLQYQVV